MAISAAMQYRQARAQGQFQKDTADYNAAVARNEATEMQNIGIEEENIKRRETAELVSKQRAQFGASGVELGSGSAFQLQQDATTLGEADAMRIRDNYQRQAESIRQGADLTEAQGNFALQAGKNKGNSAVVSSVGKMFGAGGGAASKWFTADSAANTTSSLSSVQASNM